MSKSQRSTMSKSKTASDRKPVAVTLEEIPKCFGQFFEVENTVRGMLKGSIPLPKGFMLSRETVIGAEDFLEKIGRARAEAFNKLGRVHFSVPMQEPC